ncbi:MAG: hypothetical protein ACRD0N_11235 [Acidimicrobiales bacterium]
MTTDHSLDDEVLRLRTDGKSFATIARALDFERARDANAAFNRALRRRPESEQVALRRNEQDRLDRLAEVVKADEALGADVRARRLLAVDKLRAKLLAD